MKATIVTVLTLLILLVVGVIVGPSFVDWSKYKVQAQEQIKAHTGYETVIGGDLSLALLPFPHISVENVTVNVGGEKLASFEKMNVNVELMPLLSKKIVVQSVGLVKPDIMISVLSNGTQNWMTPEVQALMDKEKPKKTQGDMARSISLEKVKIEEGRFTFKPGNARSVVVKDINVDVAAQTLKGPFEVDGSLNYNGNPLTAKAKIGALEGKGESVSLKAEGRYSEMTFSYAGIVGLKAPFSVQGETFVSVASLAEALKNPALGEQAASFKGLVTASSEQAVIKNAAISAFGNNFTGDVEVKLSPMSVTASLTGKDTLNLDKFLPKRQAQKDGFDVTALSGALPKTLSLPAGFEGRLNLAVPAAIYNGQTYGGVEATLIRQGQSLKANVKAKGPGDAAINFRSNLSFASKSVSEKTGSEILADPSLEVQAVVSASNVAQMTEALSGKNDLPYLSTAKSGDFDVSAAIRPGIIELKPSTVKLDSQSYKLSGSLKGKTAVANLEAFGGQLIVKGDLGDAGQISNMAVQVKHSSLPKALEVLNPNVAPNPLLTGPVDFYTEVQQKGSVYTLSNIKAQILNTTMTGNLVYEGAAGKPNVSGGLVFGDLVIPSSGKSPAAKAAGSGGASAGQWSSKSIDAGFLYLGNADLNIQAESIKFEKWNASKPHLTFKLSEGALSISQLDAGLFGGQLAMNADISGPRAGPLTVKSDAKLAGVQVEPLMEALAGNKLVKGRGVVSVDTQLLTSGGSQIAMINALGGQGLVTGKDIVLEGIDVSRFVRALSEESRAGDSLLSLWKGSANGGSTAFDTLDGRYTINNGIVNIEKMDLDGPRAAIATTGAVSLPKWTLKTAHEMSVKDRDDVPPFTMHIEGPLNNPGQTFAQGAINDYLSRKINRKLQKVIGGQGSGNDALDKLLGGVLGTPPKPQQEAPAPAPANDNQPQQVAPAGGEQQQEAPKEVTPEEALEGVLKDLFR